MLVKKNLLSTIVVVIITVSLILSSAPFSYANHDTLRPKATEKSTQTLGDIANSLLNSKITVAINNPGAQERELIRQWLLSKSIGVDLVGVNGVSCANLFYLLTKDFSATPEFRAWFENNIIALPEGLGNKADRKLILPVSEILNPKDFPWESLKARVVIEGEKPELASAHKNKGVEFVIVSHPALTAVSALNTILSVLPQDKIKGIDFTDIQPSSSLQRGLDNSGPDPVLMRAMGLGIAPALSRDIEEYMGKLLPNLAPLIKGKINFAPQALGSLLDIHIFVSEDTNVDSINKLFKTAVEGLLKGKLLYSQDQSLVSSDLYQQPQLIFLAKNTKVTGKTIVHLQVFHHEETAFALSQIPLLLGALKSGTAPAVVTSKDSKTISQDAEAILASIQQEQSNMVRPAFLNSNLKYIPSASGKDRPQILPSDNMTIAGINGYGRVGRPSIWAMQGDPNIDLRMINGASSALILSWLIAEDSIQQSTPKPITRIILTPAQLKKEINMLLGNYTPEQVKGFLTGLMGSQRLWVLPEKEELVPYLEKLVADWGKSADEVKPAVDWLLKSIVGVLDVSGKKVIMVNERKAVSELPWDAVGIKTVLECTGDLKNADEASAHLAHIKGGRVIISAPAEGAGQSIVLGVVEPTRAARIVDNASCTTNCLMPIVSVLNKVFGVIAQEITTVHAYTTDQKFAQQAPHKKELTRGRDGRVNMLPGSTGAAKTAGVILPTLAGRSDGWAVRTPNPTGSQVVLSVKLNGYRTKEQIQRVLQEASQKELAGILAYTQAPLTSTLIIGNPASSIVDGNAIEVISYDEELDQTIARVEAWYDNEMGFSNRMVNLAVALQGFSLVEGNVIADIGPKTVELFKAKLREISPKTVLWNGPMGVVEVEATKQGTEGVAESITELGPEVIKIVGGGDTLKTLSEEGRKKFTHVSTGGGAFLEAFQSGIEKLPGIKALINPETGNFAQLDGLLKVLKEGDRVLVRNDFNVPLDSNQNVTDNTRIKESLPTIEALLAKKAKVILMTHLGRPGGKFDPKAKTDPIAKELQKLLPAVKVYKLDDCVGKPIEDFIQNKLQPGEVVLLENTRFRLDEEQNSPGFAKDLSQLADYFVNDAFAVDHRAHASNVGVTQYFDWGKKFAGRLLENEYKYLKQIIENPQQPLVVVLGGSKVSDKIDIINALKEKAAAFLIGGRMAISFLAAEGNKVGDSTPDKADVDTATKFLADPQLKGKIIVPKDGVVVTDISTGKNAQVVEGEVEPSNMGDFNNKFLAYLRSYLPFVSAEGRAIAAVNADLQTGIARDNGDPDVLGFVEAKKSAQALGVDVEKLHLFVNADEAVYQNLSGSDFEEYISNIAASEGQITQISKVLAVSTSFLKTSGAYSALSRLAQMSKAIKVALYGDKAENFKTLFGNAEVITARSAEDLIVALAKQNIAPADIVFLSPAKDAKVTQLKARQIVAKELGPVAVAKATKELMGSDVADAAFGEFYAKVTEKGVISPEVSANNREAMLAKLQEGAFEFSENMKTTEQIAKQVASQELLVSEFIDKV